MQHRARSGKPPQGEDRAEIPLKCPTGIADVIPECSCVCLGPSRWRMALSVFSGSHTRAWLTGPGSSRMSRLLCFVGMLSFPLGQMERPGHLLARVPQDQEGGGWGLQTCCPAPESARFTTN